MFLYIDPGTGSMLFTLLIGIIGAAAYSIRMLILKLSMEIGKGRVKVDKNCVPLVVFSDNKRYWNIFEPIIRDTGTYLNRFFVRWGRGEGRQST